MALATLTRALARALARTLARALARALAVSMSGMQVRLMLPMLFQHKVSVSSHASHATRAHAPACPA